MRRLLLVATLSACGPAAGTEPLAMADLETFEARVEPHLEARCSLGGCHGRAERPLALYAPGAYRADPERTYLDEPLDAFELLENARRISAFAGDLRAADTLVIRKPLAIEAGGVWHGGGSVFVDDTDPSCRALVGWLDSRTIPDGGTR